MDHKPPRGRGRGRTVDLVSMEDHFKSYDVNIILFPWQQHPLRLSAAGQKRLQLRVLPGADARCLRHTTINNPPFGSCASWEQNQHLPECETLGNEGTMTGDKCQAT